MAAPSTFLGPSRSACAGYSFSISLAQISLSQWWACGSVPHFPTFILLFYNFLHAKGQFLIPRSLLFPTPGPESQITGHSLPMSILHSFESLRTICESLGLTPVRHLLGQAWSSQSALKNRSILSFRVMIIMATTPTIPTTAIIIIFQGIICILSFSLTHLSYKLVFTNDTLFTCFTN